MNYSTGEIVFLVLAVSLFASFGIGLAYQSWKNPNSQD